VLVSLVASVGDDQVTNLVAWASTLPNSVTEGGLGLALSRWVSLNPSQALDWLRAKPAAERESLLVAMIRTEMAPASPEIVSLAYTIRDVQKRDEALSLLVQTLTAENPRATADRIRALGLSASQTNHLLKLRPVPRE